MSDSKPFIFIEPLSDILLKLREVISETASDEGIEIFTIEDLIEANQLIPTIGQSLIICSNPKKCAAILQHNKKILSEFGSKVILLTPKVIPKKTLEKFMKVGLTECIVEPVPAKTLLYKVKLLLRSIATKKDQEELAMKSFKSDESEKSEEIENFLSKKEKNAEIEIDHESEIRATKKADEENSHWQGEIKKTHREADSGHLEGENKGADHLETHYKGNISSPVVTAEDDTFEKKKEITLDFYDDKNTHKNKKADIEIDMEDLKDLLKKRSEGHQPKGHNVGESSTDKISTHYKGQVKTPILDENEYGELVGSNDFDLEFDIPEDLKKEDIQSEKEQAETSSPTHLNLIDDSPSNKQGDIVHDEEDFCNKHKKSDFKFTDDSNSDLKKKKEEKDEQETGPHEGQIDHIESMLKGHLNHTMPEKHGAEVFQLKKATQSEEEKEKSTETLQEPDDHENLFSKKTVAITLIDDEEEEASETRQSESQDLNDLKSIEENERESSSQDSESEITPEDELTEIAPPKVDLKLDEYSETKKKSSNEAAENDFMRSKKLDQSEENASKSPMTASSHVEHIQKYYKSGEGIGHQDNNWGNGLAKQAMAVQDEFKNTQEKTLSLLTKPERGEQTIDYRKLKDQFDALTMGSDGKLKMQDVLFTDNSANKKRRGPRYYRDDEENKNEIASEEILNEDKGNSQNIYTPKLCGLDFVLTMLKLYEDKEKADIEFFKCVDDHLGQKYHAHSAFFCKSPGNDSFTPVHISNFGHENFNFQDLAVSKIETWNLMSLPFWYDHTFQSREQMFLFPYCEGTQKIGYAVIHFFAPLAQEQSHEVEVALESLRGIYLQIFHQTGLTGHYQGMETKAKEESGFMKKLMFWKKAG